MPGMDGPQLNELIRRIEQLLNYGTVAEVNLSAARCRVRHGELLSAWVPWINLRAGTTRVWNPPTVGEQCLLLAPGGRLEASVALLGIYADSHPAPSSSANLHHTVYPDGTQITYDHHDHALTAVLAEGGSATITANHCTLHADDLTFNAPTVTVNGDITLNGEMNATGDVTAGGISLINHTHGQVKAGSDTSGPPQ